MTITTIARTLTFHKNESTKYQEKSLDGYEHIRPLKAYRTSNPKSLIIGHININSVRYKCIEMSDYLSENLLDVLFIAETKLDASFPSPQFHVDGFKLHRSDRNEHGGGIMAYVRCDLAHRRRTDLENVVVTPVESLVLEVVLRQEKWLFVCLYSPSNSAKKQCCDSISTIFDVTATECIAMPFIIGDLNINMSCPSDANNLKDVMDMHGLYNLVHEPTCFKGKTPSLIDVILTCNVKRVVPTINFDTGLSDFHNMVCFATKIHVPRSQENVITYRSYKKFDDENFKHDVENAPYHVGEIFDDFDDKFWFQKKLMEGVINGHAPIKRRKAPKKPVPFMNAQLRKACHYKAMRRNKYFRHGRT